MRSLVDRGSGSRPESSPPDFRRIFDRILQDHPTLKNVPLARTRAAIEGRIGPDERDYEWGRNVRAAWEAYDNSQRHSGREKLLLNRREQRDH